MGLAEAPFCLICKIQCWKDVFKFFIGCSSKTIIQWHNANNKKPNNLRHFGLIHFSTITYHWLKAADRYSRPMVGKFSSGDKKNFGPTLRKHSSMVWSFNSIDKRVSRPWKMFLNCRNYFDLRKCFSTVHMISQPAKCISAAFVQNGFPYIWPTFLM